MTMPGDIGFDSGTSFWGTNLTIAVLNGTIPQWRLDDMVTRIVAAWYYVDREDNQVADSPNFVSFNIDGSRTAHANDRIVELDFGHFRLQARLRSRGVHPN